MNKLDTSSTLESLWEACLRGDRMAQAQLYQRTSSKMYGICLRYAAEEEDAAEILQLAYIKVFTRMNQYTGTGSFEGWIRRIIVNTAISYLRDRKPTQNTEDVWDLAVQGSLKEAGNDPLAYKELLELIRQLPEGYRMVFNLYVIEGYSHKEIAELLGIHEGTSKSQLLRAREWLQKKLHVLEGGSYEFKYAK